jgi:hypothetical protein
MSQFNHSTNVDVKSTVPDIKLTLGELLSLLLTCLQFGTDRNVFSVFTLLTPFFNKDKDKQSMTGLTHLYTGWAAERNMLYILKKLIEHGASLNKFSIFHSLKHHAFETTMFLWSLPFFKQHRDYVMKSAFRFYQKTVITLHKAGCSFSETTLQWLFLEWLPKHPTYTLLQSSLEIILRSDINLSYMDFHNNLIIPVLEKKNTSINKELITFFRQNVLTGLKKDMLNLGRFTYDKYNNIYNIYAGLMDHDVMQFLFNSSEKHFIICTNQFINAFASRKNNDWERILMVIQINRHCLEQFYNLGTFFDYCVSSNYIPIIELIMEKRTTFKNFTPNLTQISAAMAYILLTHYTIETNYYNSHISTKLIKSKLNVTHPLYLVHRFLQNELNTSSEVMHWHSRVTTYNSILPLVLSNCHQLPTDLTNLVSSYILGSVIGTFINLYDCENNW